MNKKILISIGITILFLGLSVVPLGHCLELNDLNYPISFGKTLYVGGSGPGNYTRIQHAIYDASPGDTVFVFDDSSPYYEDSIVIGRTIDLIGENKETTIIQGGGYEKVIIVTGEHVTISGFNIQKSGGGCPTDFEKTDAGIYIQNADNIKIFDNILQNNRGEGICIRNSQNCVIENNLIRDNRFRGILITSESHNILITHNTIKNNTKGGIIGNEIINLNVIENNILFNGQGGIEFISTYDSLIKRNNFYENGRDAEFTFYGYTDSTNGIFYFFQFIKEIIKGRTLKFDNNFWNIGRILPYELYYGNVIIEGPFSWMTGEYRYSKFDRHPAKEPYDI